MSNLLSTVITDVKGASVMCSVRNASPNTREDLVSIIIPCYNAEKWIKECIDSALSQTYSPIEIIVVDDGSTDNSLSIIKKYGDKVRWVSYENGGVSTARNKGIQLSQGEFIQFIDADDYISPLKIEEQLRMLKASNVDVVYSDWCNQYHELDGSIKLADYKTHQPTDDILYYSLAYNKIHIGSCLYKCEVLEKVLGFDESLEIAEDYDFFTNCLTPLSHVKNYLIYLTIVTNNV